MLGNEPALSKYMKEAPRRRDEGIISKDMMTQIGFMGVWLVILSFLFLKLPVITNLFDNKAQHLTAYFVLFIFSALFNGFNVRDERFGIFKRLNENPDFLKVFFIIMLVQIMIVNAAAIPFQVFTWIGKMFSCVPFGAKGLDCYCIVVNDDDPCGLFEKISVWLWKIGGGFYDENSGSD